MYKVLFIALAFCLAPGGLMAQVSPKEGVALHYRLIGFSLPAGRGGQYQLEIATGYYNDEDSFKRNIIKSVVAENNKVAAVVPSFGAQYTWRAFATANTAKHNSLHHFSTASCTFVDTGTTRFRVMQHAGTYKAALVFLDGNKALYDMTGHPVWYLPGIAGLDVDKADIRDMKLTPQGTITFLANDKKAFEIDYDGNILWKGPNNEDQSNDIHYHHQFTRLANGHYMVAGTEPVLLKQLYGQRPDSAVIAPADEINIKAPNAKYFNFPFGTIVEYDQDGKVVWSWKTSQYMDGTAWPYYKPERGKNKYDIHTNAFFFDEKTNNIYIGFRNISWIAKAAYPSGEIQDVYGEIARPGIPKKGDGPVCGQHSICRTADGYLCVYDNNAGNVENMPRVLLFKEPRTANGKLKTVWEYQCTLGDHEKQQKTMGFTTGGNAVELPDGSLFVSMSAPYGKVFIVNRDKEILWSAVAEKWSPEEKKWNAVSQYRASIICDDTAINKMVWGVVKE
jgi:hypothetical protein